MGKKIKNTEVNCPICGEFIEVACTGHSNKSLPFVDGRTYPVICFICFSVPKVWEIIYGEAKDGSQDIYDGPFYDHKHLYSAQELIENGITNDFKLAKKSVVAVKKKISEAKKRGKMSITTPTRGRGLD
jgi:hypothetical protein